MASGSIAAARVTSNRLLRVLGLGFGVAVGLGTVIGGRILRTPGSVLDQVPVAWLALLLWGLAGVHALLSFAADTRSAMFMILGVAACIPMSILAKRRRRNLAIEAT